MLSYFEAVYVNQRYGVGLILTVLFTAWGAMALLTKVPDDHGCRFWLRWFGKGLLFYLAYIVIDSVSYWITGLWSWNIERACMLLFLILYSWLGSGFSWQTCLVRSGVYFTSYVLMVPVSEPIGQALKEINDSWYDWGSLCTPLIILLMTAAVVWFLRHFSYDRRRFSYRQVVVQLLTVACLSAAAEIVWAAVSPEPNELATSEKLYNVFMCGVLWAINLFSYYSFYQLAKATVANENLLSVKHKNELELERFQTTSVNFDELRMIRHEIKNHDFYLKVLLSQGKYNEAQDYLSRNSASESVLLKTFECGNYVVDVILNHSMAVARRSNVEIRPEILIPPELPMPEDDVCSLLSNLLDNAIEAASQSGTEKPVIHIRMQPRGEYLFIRVSNPVSRDISGSRRLTLKTTKKDSELHGFGTRIMKRIVEKNKGSIRFSMEEDTFITDVML